MRRTALSAPGGWSMPSSGGAAGSCSCRVCTCAESAGGGCCSFLAAFHRIICRSRYRTGGANYRVSRPFPVHVAFSATGNLAFAVCLETRNFTIQSLHAIVDELDQMHEAMKSVATLDS